MMNEKLYRKAKSFLDSRDTGQIEIEDMVIFTQRCLREIKADLIKEEKFRYVNKDDAIVPVVDTDIAMTVINNYLN